MAWLLCITGILFCVSGIFLFQKNTFEEDKSIRPSVMIMIMGVLLIALGTAKYFHLIQ